MRLDIMIVSYKRPKVLDYTLKHLAEQITQSTVFDSIRVLIGLNEASDEDVQVCEKYIQTEFPEIITFAGAAIFKDNRGKAAVLNGFYDTFDCYESDYILQLDGDMVFKAPFMPILDAATKLKFDILGFSSQGYWGHIPDRNACTMLPWNGYNIYYTAFIAGGIMMFHAPFLYNHKWTNEDGIYGGDDYNICLTTDSKFILEDTSDWLQHDPIGAQMPELKSYYNTQRIYREAGMGVLPKGWLEKGLEDENLIVEQL